MAISYLVLGQIIPPANAATNLYTVPPYISTVVSTIAVCNQANTPTTFSLSIRPAGATVETKHYLNYNTAIAGNDTIALTLGITLATTDVVTATSASGTVSFVAFGAETGTLPVIVAPIINTIAITDSSYNTISETAIALTGGYIKLTGSGFTSGSVVYVNGVSVTSTYVSPAEVRVELPAKTAGTYSLMLFTSTGLGAIYANGIVYSSVPTWTATSYNNTTPTNVVNVQLLASGDAPLTYSLQSGSSLPTGVTLSSTGLVSGTATGISSNTTVTFTVVVTDPQAQSAPQLISLSLTFFVTVFASATYDAQGWVSASTDYTGTTGAFSFSFGSLQSASGGARTVPLPYLSTTKGYFEIYIVSGGGSSTLYGIVGDASAGGYTNIPCVWSQTGGGLGGYSANLGSPIANGDTVMVAYNASTGKVFYGKNGTWSIDPVSGTGGTIPNVTAGSLSPRLIVMCGSSGGTAMTGTFKTGSLVAYPAPSGYTTL